jgi:hypothetical protein
MPFIIRNEENKICINHVDSNNAIDHIPAYVYRIDYNPRTGAIELVKDRPRFDLPTKCYGKVESYKTTIVDHFSKTTGATGVMLTGIKGSGKSLTAELIANTFIVKDYPVFIIDRKIPAELILTVARIASPCMFYFDEFGKIYHESHTTENTSSEQDSLLPLFSDTSLKKVMFVVTGNSYNEFSNYIINRPGRFFFSINFDKADEEIITEICNDFKIIPSITRLLIGYSDLMTDVSIDIIRAAVNIAKDCKSITEFRSIMQIVNLPSLPKTTFNIAKVMNGSIDVTDTTTISYLAKAGKMGIYGDTKVGNHTVNIYELISEDDIPEKGWFELDLFNGLKITLQRRMAISGMWSGTESIHIGKETPEHKENIAHNELIKKQVGVNNNYQTPRALLMNNAPQNIDEPGIGTVTYRALSSK